MPRQEYVHLDAIRTHQEFDEPEIIRSVFLSVLSVKSVVHTFERRGSRSTPREAAQLLFIDDLGGAIVPEDDGDFLTRLARNVLNGTKLADLQTLFTDELQVSTPLGCPTEVSPLLVPVLQASQNWDEWLRQHSVFSLKPTRGRNGKHGSHAFPGQLSIWKEN